MLFYKPGRLWQFPARIRHREVLSAGGGSSIFISGWKDIATYLNKGVRTVQRYEREIGLPIHRPSGKSAGSVIATKTELEHWVKAGPVGVKHWPTQRTNAIGAEFLQVDSEIALTFSGLALGARDEGNRGRTAQAAHRAYETIMRLRERIELTEAQTEKLDRNLLRLKSELQRLGEIF